MNVRELKRYIPFRNQLYKIKMIFKGKEKKESWGQENPDKIFYVIGQEDTNGGLFWLINKTIMHIGYAIDQGYIPVIDYKHYKTQYTTEEMFSKENLWEIFFEQPCGYALSDICNCKNIIINKMAPSPNKKYLMGQYEFYDNPKRIEYFRRIFQKYIRFNEGIKKHLSEVFQNVTKDKEDIIGVLCRGTDYVLLKPKNHPIQPSTEIVVKDVHEAMDKYRCSKVFLATEDKDILEYFKKEFGEKLLFLHQKRLSKNDMSGKMFLAEEKKKDKHINTYDDALKYLEAIYILSHCKCFIGGRTGGTKGVLLMTKGFTYNKIYDLGLYK